MGEEASVSTVRLGPKQLTMPSSWKELTLGEINDSEQPICYGVLKPGPDHEEGIPLIKIEDIEDGFLESGQNFHLISEGLSEDFSRSVLQGGEVLVSIQGTVGRVAVVPPGLAGANISRTVGRLTPREVNALWLKYCLESKDLQDYISILSSGSTRASYNIGDIRTTTVPVPPFEEQRKIASVLYTVDELIEESEQIKSRLQRLEKGIRRWLLRHGLRNEDQKEVRVQSQSIRMPQSWQMVPLANIARNGPGTFTDGDWVESDDMVEDGPFQLIQLKHIGEGQFKGECDRFVSEEFFREEGCTEVEEGDLLISRMAEPILRTIRVPEFEKRSITAVDVVVAKVDETEWEPDYVRAVLNTKTWQDIARAFASGSTRLRISRFNMEKIEIPKPSLEEQREIAMVLGRIEGALERGEQYLGRLERLKHGLMQDLLTGKVRTKDVDIEIPEEVAAYG